MFTLEKEIENVYDILFTEYGEVLVVGEDYKYHFVCRGKEIKDPLIDGLGGQFVFCSGNIFISDTEQRTYFLDPEKQEVHFYGKIGHGIAGNGNELLLHAKEDGSYCSKMINIGSGSTLLKPPFLVTHAYFTNDFFFCTDSENWHKILCYNRATYDLAWELDVSKYGGSITGKGSGFKGYLGNIIGEWNDLLLLHIAHCKVLAVNKEGKKVWELDNMLLPKEYVNFSWGFGKGNMSWLLNAEQGKLCLLGRYYLMEFDLHTFKRTVLLDYSQAELANKWSFSAGEMHDDHILFTGSLDNPFSNSIGLIDLSVNEVTWHYTLKKRDQAFIKPPVIYNDRLYAVDSEKQLHIFKRVR